MRVDLRYLKKLGISAGAYKALFTGTDADRNDQNRRGVNDLIYLLSERIKRGRELNLSEYKSYAAIDLAYDAPFRQVTPTIIQSICQKKLDAKQTLDQLHKWGISEDELFLDAVVNGEKKQILNIPTFFNIVLPLVKAYTTIRAAKLYNDRNQTPLFRYQPLKHVPKDRLVCEIVTDMVETMTTNLGYQTVLRSAINHMLKYGSALAFPREEWFWERHAFVDEEGRVENRVLREGLRYIFPHPTRTFFDQYHPLTSVNTDSGTEFAGYWSVCKYSDILDNHRYWNRQSIPYSNDQWWNSGLARNYFQEVYPCQIKFPTFQPLENNREQRVQLYNNDTDRDSSVFLCNIYAKIIPSVYSLGPYDFPLWHRFVMANEDTVIYAEPCAYNPLWFMGYDYDDQSAQQSSFSLEAIPFQDHIGNILSQMILSAKNNLANIIFYDEAMIDRTDVETVKNQGEMRYRSHLFVPFDSLKQQRAGVDHRQAFHRVDFGHQDISGLVTTMSGVLNIMERVLQMSSQEVGAAAQHYQSAKEIAVTNQATTNRLAYTGSHIDDAIDAWKQQLYDAATAYADPDVLAEVSEDIPDLRELVEQIGFQLLATNRNQRAVLSGNKKALRLNGFARADNSPYREENMQLSQVIYQTVGVIANNQPMFERVGVDNVLKLLEEAAYLSGAPVSFRLPLDKNSSPANIQEWVTQQLQQLSQNIMQQVEQNVARPAAEKVSEHEGEISELQALTKKLTGIFKMVDSMSKKGEVEAQKARQEMQLKAEAHDEEQRRLEEEHDAEMRREEEMSEVETAVKLEKAEADAEAQRIKAKAAARVASAKNGQD